MVTPISRHRPETGTRTRASSAWRILQRKSAVLIGAWLLTAAAENAPLEDAVKATFLYKFGEFVQWPAETVTEGAPFVLCAVGDDGVTAVMDRAAAGQRVGTRPVTVRHLQMVS